MRDANSDAAASIVRRYFEAYPARDRAAIEAVVAEDFHFTSPLDNRIDRAAYFERCWPVGEDMAAHDLRHVAVSGDTVFVAYEVRMKDGRRFRNAEFMTLSGGQIVTVEVYFGWGVPHMALEGGFVSDEDASESDFRRIIDARAKAIHAGDVDAMVADVADDVVTFDVVEPLRSLGKGGSRPAGEGMAGGL